MKKFKIMSVFIAIIMTLVLLVGCEGNTTSKENNVVSKTNGEIRSDSAYKDSLDKYGIVDNGDSITFVDSRNKEVTVKKNPTKVVCAYNSYLDLWYKLGGKVIGRVEESDEKPVLESKDAAIVGTSGNPSAETIISLQPDLVILSNAFSTHVKLSTVLEESDIPVLCMEIGNKNDYMKLVRIYTALLEREDSYEKYATDINDGIDKIISKVPQSEKPRVMLMMCTAKGTKIKDSDSINGEILKDLNAEIIGDGIAKGKGSVDFSMEVLLEENPDLIFVTEMGSDTEKIKQKRMEDLENSEVWSSLTAVKEGKYIILPKDLYTYKPNDRYLEAYDMIFEYLYPKLSKK